MPKQPLGTHDSNVINLPVDVQKNVEIFLQWLIDIEKKHYHSDVEPFERHAKKMELEGLKLFQNTFKRLENAQSTIKHSFELEEKARPDAYQESSWNIWKIAADQASEQINHPDFLPSMIVPLQVQMSLPWEWMNRAYNLASRLMLEKKYEAARDVYFFLRHLHAAVFEYWVGEATCQHMLHQFHEAIDTYSLALLFQPENALLFFQIADCLHNLSEKSQCLKALKISIEYAKNDTKQAALLAEAIQLKKALELQK